MAILISPEGRGVLTVNLVGGTSTANGGLGALPNPEGADVLILRATLYVRTSSAGAADLGVGVAASATTKGTDIVNDLAVNAAAGKVYNGFVMQNGAKTEIAAPALWTTSKYLTFTGSASTVGLTASLYLEYVRL